ncbi:hypothetical protein B0I35DRAFT_422274 [Stachybotrys elegans]|uniref:Uncharacterized protein n=1 Tax=Stachybotrys elegans TaxID=80388 RepID=A0A8K0T4C6_9HYPO|nr:hypothetical protein B0I35DRAFT_422274 [Stachybotrys elegans]
MPVEGTYNHHGRQGLKIESFVMWLFMSMSTIVSMSTTWWLHGAGRKGLAGRPWCRLPRHYRPTVPGSSCAAEASKNVFS